MDKDKNTSKPGDAGLFIPNRQLSIVASGALALLFFVFIGGYFLGKNQVVEPFVARVEQDSFADQIYSSLCALSQQEAASPSAKQIEIAEARNACEAETIPIPPAPLTVSPKIENESIAVLAKEWYAQLIGYGKKQSALDFVSRLQKRGITVTMKTRISSTAKGKKRQWYQVVTESYTDRAALQALVDRVTHEEKLKGVQIRSC